MWTCIAASRLRCKAWVESTTGNSDLWCQYPDDGKEADVQGVLPAEAALVAIQMVANYLERLRNMGAETDDHVKRGVTWIFLVLEKCLPHMKTEEERTATKYLVNFICDENWGFSVTLAVGADE